MKLRLPGHSLRFRITVGTLLPLLIVLALSSYLQYLRHRDLMLDRLHRTAADTSRIVESSLGHAMLKNDRLEIRRIVARVAAQRGVRRLLLLDKQGKIAVSADQRDMGKTLDIHDRTCQACHGTAQASQKGALVIADQTGHRVLRSVTAIVKRPTCQACHERTETTYGVLILDFDMAELEGQLAAERRNTLLWSLGALALLVLVINLIMRRLVVGPLERLTEVVRRVGQGELGRRVGLAGNGEVAELAQTFDHMAEELQRKEALRGQLIEQLLSVQEEERRRLARELHDGTSQLLTSLLVGLKMLAQTDSLAAVREQAAQLRGIAAQTLDSVHELAVQLRPSDLDDMGLVAATRHLASTFASRFGIQAHFQAVGFEDLRLSPPVETTLYRIVQEALTNVARHAAAHNVDILLECRGDKVLAVVEDDGRGFDVEAVLGQRNSRRLGLFGMQERAALAGGQLTVESSASGVTILAEIPLEQVQPPDDQGLSTGDRERQAAAGSGGEGP